MLCVLFSEVYCVKGLCLLLFPSCQETVYTVLAPSVASVNWIDLQNLRGEILPPSLRNVMCFILRVKRVTKITGGPLIFFCVTCVRLLTGWVNASRQMPCALHMVWRKSQYHSLEWFDCLTNSRNRLQIQKHGKISRFAIYSEASPTQRRVAFTEACGKSDL
jgi:hypothetical protein